MVKRGASKPPSLAGLRRLSGEEQGLGRLGWMLDLGGGEQKWFVSKESGFWRAERGGRHDAVANN